MGAIGATARISPRSESSFPNTTKIETTKPRRKPPASARLIDLRLTAAASESTALVALRDTASRSRASACRSSVVALRNGMISGMTTVKRAVTIDEELEREARALAGENFSAFVSEAVSRHVRRLKLEQLVQADEAERGPVDPEAEAQVEAELAALDRDHEAVPARPE